MNEWIEIMIDERKKNCNKETHTGIGNGNGLNFSLLANNTPNNNGINVFFFIFAASTICWSAGINNMVAAIKPTNIMANLWMNFIFVAVVVVAIVVFRWLIQSHKKMNTNSHAKKNNTHMIMNGWMVNKIFIWKTIGFYIKQPRLFKLTSPVFFLINLFFIFYFRYKISSSIMALSLAFQ